MEEKKVQNEELQSRRDFFRNAAKAALPILAGAVIASNPLLAASAETPMGCNYSCSGGCAGSCSGYCGYNCSGSCKSGCGGCKGACTSSCTSCAGGCKGYY